MLFRLFAFSRESSPHSGKALLEDRSILAGTWLSRTAEYRNRNRSADAEEEGVTSTHEIPLAQLPCWRHLTYGDYCKEVRRLIREIEDEAALERKLSRTEVLGARAVLEADPQTVPEKTKTSYAPRVHAATKQARIDFRVAYGTFLAEFLDAAEDLRNGVENPSFPEGCFPPGLPYVGETGLPPDPGD